MQKQWGPVLAGLAPLALYYGVEAWWTKTAALLMMLTWMAGEFAFYRWRRWPITPLFVFANLVILGFALEDLWLERTHASAWEPVLTNGVSALACLSGAAFLRLILGELFAQAQRPPPGPSLVSFLRILLGLWAVFFLATSALAAFLAQHPQAPAWLRHGIGYGPAAVLALLCVLCGKRGYLFLLSRGCLSAPHTSLRNPSQTNT